jgi:hypothetical protein
MSSSSRALRHQARSLRAGQDPDAQAQVRAPASGSPFFGAAGIWEAFPEQLMTLRRASLQSPGRVDVDGFEKQAALAHFLKMQGAAPAVKVEEDAGKPSRRVRVRAAAVRAAPRRAPAVGERKRCAG